MGLLTGKTALVTGAARGIGKAIALKFAQEGANIAFTDLVIDENGKATEAEIAAFGVKAKGYASNAADFAQSEEVVKQVKEEFGSIDILINNAGITKDGLMLRMTEQQWDAVIAVNLKSAFNFIHACVPVMMRQRGGSIINMASVVGVHGNAGQANYSASKAGADHIVLAYGETYKMPINITRCSNNYGPYHFPEKLIPLMIKNVLEGKKLPVYGKGDNVRDWLYVEDHCKGIDLVVRNGKLGEVYNIGGFNEEQNINIVKLVIDILKDEITANDEYKKVLKTDLSNVNYNLITYVQDRLGHDMRYAIDPSKIARELGWYPETDFETGIRKTVKWYLENQEWVNEVVSGDYQKYYDEMYGGK